jgi:ABC-type antimicrobial peptide transport system permease subunit
MTPTRNTRDVITRDVSTRLSETTMNLIFKNLQRRKFRSLLTMLGIGIGVMAIVALGAMADSLSAGYDNMLNRSQADLVLSQPDAIDISYSSVDEQVGQELLAMPEVAEISSMLQGFTQAEGNPIFMVFGYPEDSFVLERFQIKTGYSFDAPEARALRGKPILLGATAAETLKKQPGDTLRLIGSVYRILGVYETGDAFEDSGAVLPLAEAQELLGKPRQVSLYYIRLKDPSLSERLEARAARRWEDLSLSTTGNFADKQLMGPALQAYVWAISGLAIVIGGIGMMNAQLMAVMERTREIGVLRSVGWSRRRVMWMILGETLVVSLLGGLLGVLLGWLSIDALSRVAITMGASGSNIRWQLIAQSLGVALVLGLVGGLYPARRAARMQPVEALRYEGGTGGGKVRRLPFGGLAVQGLWQRTARTLLTLGAIGLTVGAIMALEAVIRGTAATMDAMAIGVDAEVMLRQADIADTSLSAIDNRVGERIAALPEVKSISGMIFTAVMLPEENSFFVLMGYAPNEFAIQRFRLVAGTRLTGNRQIMLGRSISEALNKDIGDTMDVSGRRFRVVGIYETGGGWEELGGVVTLRDAQNFIGRPNKVTMYSLKLTNPEQARAVVDKINVQFPDVVATLSGEFASQLPDMANAQGMIGGISFMAILVGGVGVLNTMLMSVVERTREIGVLRALGWRRRRILWLILREALLLGLLGGIAGLCIAFGMLVAMGQIPNYGEMLTPIWGWDILARALAVSLLLGVIGGLYPAFRATRLQPVEALRYE